MNEVHETTYASISHSAVIAGPQCKLNPTFLRTFPGISTIAEIILAIIVIVYVGKTGILEVTGFILFTAIGALLLESARLTMHLFSLAGQADCFAWKLTELVLFLIWTAFYFISLFIFGLIFQNFAAMFFCFVADVLFCIRATLIGYAWCRATATEVIASGIMAASAQPPASVRVA